MNLADMIEGKANRSNFFKNKTQITIADLIAKNPNNNFTLKEISKGIGKYGDYIAFTTHEYPDYYSFGNSIFNENITEWIEQIGGSIELNNSLKTTIVKFTFIQRTNKKGNEYLDVDFHVEKNF